MPLEKSLAQQPLRGLGRTDGGSRRRCVKRTSYQKKEGDSFWRHYRFSPISQKERFFAPLRMTLDRVVILNEVKDLEPKMSLYQERDAIDKTG
jgi:hypothetical protein